MNRECWEKLLVSDWTIVFLLPNTRLDKITPLRKSLRGPDIEIDKVTPDDKNIACKCKICFQYKEDELYIEVKFNYYLEKEIIEKYNYYKSLTPQELFLQFNDETKDMLMNPIYDLKVE